jgi:branched-chain amino acid transport system ATP-binding protein
MALTGDPKLLLLDEPTSGVSAEEKFPMMATIMDALGQEVDTTVLFVEHDMDIVERHASRVIAFYAGRVIADDVPAVALSAADVRRYVTGELLPQRRRQDIHAAHGDGPPHTQPGPHQL